MVKKPVKDKVTVNMLMDVSIWEKIVSLSHRYGVSCAFIVRRSLVRTINEGISWPEDGRHEKRENEKFGAATPIYDNEADPQAKAPETGKKAPASPAQ